MRIISQRIYDEEQNCGIIVQLFAAHPNLIGMLFNVNSKLNVARWCEETEKWAHWSKLTPLEEKIEIKGAYLNKDGNELPKELVSEFRMKASAIRSERLYKYGYT